MKPINWADVWTALKNFINVFSTPTVANPPEINVNPMPKPAPVPQTPTVSMFCKAIEHLEGYFPPSAQHPTGTTAWRNKNPGNMRCPPLNHLADKCVNNFCHFADYATGFHALELNMINVIKGGAKAAGYYPEMDLVAFFNHRDPASDGNDPLSCAINVATFLGVSIHFKLNELTI